MFAAKLKVLAVIIPLLIALGFAIYFAKQEEGRALEPAPKAGSVEEVPLSLADGQYVAKEGDSCWSIARSLTGVESEENVRVFAALNSFSISQEGRLRGVPFEECPIRAGETYKVPAGWVPPEQTVREVLVQDDYPHWKSIAFIGIPCAVAFGIILGRVAPPIARRFRRKKDLSQLPSGWELSEQE